MWRELKNSTSLSFSKPRKARCLTTKRTHDGERRMEVCWVRWKEVQFEWSWCTWILLTWFAQRGPGVLLVSTRWCKYYCLVSFWYTDKNTDGLHYQSAYCCQIWKYFIRYLDSVCINPCWFQLKVYIRQSSNPYRDKAKHNGFRTTPLML